MPSPNQMTNDQAPMTKQIRTPNVAMTKWSPSALSKIAGRVAAAFAAERAPDAVGAAGAGVGSRSDGGEVAGIDVVVDEARAAVGHGDLDATGMFAGGGPDPGKQVSGN